MISAMIAEVKIVIAKMPEFTGCSLVVNLAAKINKRSGVLRTASIYTVANLPQIGWWENWAMPKIVPKNKLNRMDRIEIFNVIINPDRRKNRISG